MVTLGDGEVLGRYLFKTYGPLTVGSRSETSESICTTKALSLTSDLGDMETFTCGPQSPGKGDVVRFLVP